MSTESNSLIESKIAELTNVHRIASNALSVIGDADIKGAHAQPVSEVIQWLQSFKGSLNAQIVALKDTLPKPEAKPEVASPVLAEVK